MYSKRAQLTVGIVVVLAVAIGVALYVGSSGGDEAVSDSDNPSSILDSSSPSLDDDSGGVVEEDSFVEWKMISLVDVSSDGEFRIADLSDKPVLLESFAVWCPKCTKQQKVNQELHDDPSFGDKFYSVALNTDSQEDDRIVLDHISSNGFTGSKYAVAPESFTQQLIDEYGFKIVNAPSVPMILLCPGQEEEFFLKSGSKDAEYLMQEISDKCGVQ
jgi:thiol-disulfide isomerase/thioredoxin